MEATEESPSKEISDGLIDELLSSREHGAPDTRDLDPLLNHQDTVEAPVETSGADQQGVDLLDQIFESAPEASPQQIPFAAPRAHTQEHYSDSEEQDRKSDSDGKSYSSHEDFRCLESTGHSAANRHETTEAPYFGHSTEEADEPPILQRAKFDAISETGDDDFAKSVEPDPSQFTVDTLSDPSDDMETPAAAAVCRYRWSKTVATNSADVGFYLSAAPNDPVLLTWDETPQAYFSDQIKITSGDYHGNLVVDGKSFPIEDFSVRSYTFEVDLFVKEDDLTTQESNLPKVNHSSESLDKVAPIADQEIKISSRIEELVRHQLAGQENKSNRDGIQGRSMSQSPPVAMTRDSPIGNDGKEATFELSANGLWGSGDLRVKYQTEEKQSDRLERPSSRGYDGLKSDVVEDVIGVLSQRSFSQGSENLDRENSLKGSSRPPSANSFVQSPDGEVLRRSRPSSVGDTNFDGAEKRGSRPTSVGILPSPASSSLVGSPRHTPTHEALLGRPMSSDRFSPSSSQRSIDKTELSPGRSFPGSRRSSSPLQNPVAGNIDNISPSVWNTTVSGHSTPQKSMAFSQLTSERSKLGENGAMINNHSSKPPSHPSTRTPSRNSSSVSMTSEPELAQYMEAKSRHSSGERAIGKSQPLYSDELFLEAQGVKGSDRAASLPNYRPQNVDGRSYTPDNRVRVPPADLVSFRNALVTERMEDMLGRSSQPLSAASLSRNSSRSATPVASDSTVKDMSNIDQIYDLEASVSNLRKLLTNRESEVHTLQAQIADLKDINRSLREELEHRVHRHTPSSHVQESAEFKQLQSEKEILASEIVNLREQLQRMNKSQTPSGRSSVNSGIVDYNPTSPAVLQRKIADLEAHIRDMQEVTESTTASLTRAEDKVKQLQEENTQLKTKLKNNSELQNGIDQHSLRVELRTLREDIRSLKERNYQLTEENMRLLEGQGSRTRDTDLIPVEGPRLSSSLKSDEGTRYSPGYSTSSLFKRDFTPPGTSLSQNTENSVLSSPSLSRKDISLRDLRHSAHNRSYDADLKVSDANRLLQQRNSLESSRLRTQSKDRSAGSKSASYTRSNLTYSDRSVPDGEVAEKLYSDRYSKLTAPMDKKMEEPSEKLGTSSYLDKHYAALREGELSDYKLKQDYDERSREDKHKYTRDSLRDVDLRTTSSGLQHSSSSAISSKDIFLSLKHRTRRWLNEVDRGQRPTDYDSDSTEVLMLGLTGQCPEKSSPKNGTSSSSSSGEKMKKEISASLFTKENKYISGNLDFQRYHSTSGRHADDTGDDSDTATDILLAQDTTPRASQRRPSLGSDGTGSNLSDNEDESLMRRRSKSVDTNRSQDSSRSRPLSTLPRSGLTARSVTSIDSMRASAGLRSVLPAPQVTQHNKGELLGKNLSSLLNSSLTQGLRPFAPRSIADIRVEDVIKFSRVGGKLTQGVVKYVGHLPGRSEAYLGVELDKDEGKHDGTFESIRYFKCKPNKGVFVAFNKVVMAWAP
ncbi:unnamed protein product [Lymnaea stagnalis]|uniref:CAP-Gly domain-containing protein n=1 Tax=Lymnaea stagnalis TaxID=6523 RepID=A0AAV2I8N2_LYMST